MAEDASDNLFSNEYATFGDRLAAARDAMGQTQGELARKLGVKRSTLERWEDDRAEPRSNRLQMLAGVLNVSLVWLMTGEGEEPSGIEQDDDHIDAEAALRELSSIRAEQRRLSERSGRLEKRLRAILIS